MAVWPGEGVRRRSVQKWGDDAFSWDCGEAHVRRCTCTGHRGAREVTRCRGADAWDLSPQQRRAGLAARLLSRKPELTGVQGNQEAGYL